MTHFPFNASPVFVTFSWTRKIKTQRIEPLQYLDSFKQNCEKRKLKKKKQSTVFILYHNWIGIANAQVSFMNQAKINWFLSDDDKIMCKIWKWWKQWNLKTFSIYEISSVRRCHNSEKRKWLCSKLPSHHKE